MECRITHWRRFRYFVYGLGNILPCRNVSRKSLRVAKAAFRNGPCHRWYRYDNVIPVSNPELSKISPSLFIRNSNNQYGLSTINIWQYLDNLQGLSCLIRMWPPQTHANTMASKWELAQTLDFIAQERTKSARPKTRLLMDGEPILNVMVLKRTHSDAGEHVILPSDTDKHNWAYCCSQLDVPGSQWMAQSFVEPLMIEIHGLGIWSACIIHWRNSSKCLASTAAGVLIILHRI